MATQNDAATKPGEVMTIGEICADIQMSRSTIYKEIREERLTARKIGKSTRVLREDYKAYLHALPIMSASRAA